MGMVLVFPANSVEGVQNLMVGGVRMVHPVLFENKFVCCLQGVGSRSALANGGMANNIIGFNNAQSTKHMWKVATRFDATGLMIDESNWSVDTDLRYLIHHKLETMASKKDMNDFSSTLLMQYAIALCGPDFCPNQLEYGKRAMLRKMLLD